MPAPHLVPDDAARGAAAEVLGPIADGAFIALAPGSVWATKRWPFYPELAASLSVTHPIVVIGGAGDRELAEAIVAACPTGRARDATGRLSLLARRPSSGRRRSSSRTTPRRSTSRRRRARRR